MHDNTVTWLATWTENVNGATKYVWLAANSTLKGKSDMKKYDKARELKVRRPPGFCETVAASVHAGAPATTRSQKYIDEIRRVYTAELSDNKTVTRQRATAMYLIDKVRCLESTTGNVPSLHPSPFPLSTTLPPDPLAHEGSHTFPWVAVGSSRCVRATRRTRTRRPTRSAAARCAWSTFSSASPTRSSLTFWVRLGTFCWSSGDDPAGLTRSGRGVMLPPLAGKDSMRYYNEVQVETTVFKNLRLFRRGNKDDNKKPGDMLFDRITVQDGGRAPEVVTESDGSGCIRGRWGAPMQTSLVNKHLNSLMPGLTAKVFRTYNASITFQVRSRANAPAGSTHAREGEPDAPTRLPPSRVPPAFPPSFRPRSTRVSTHVRAFRPPARMPVVMLPAQVCTPRV